MLEGSCIRSCVRVVLHDDDRLLCKCKGEWVCVCGGDDVCVCVWGVYVCVGGVCVWGGCMCVWGGVGIPTAMGGRAERIMRRHIEREG